MKIQHAKNWYKVANMRIHVVFFRSVGRWIQTYGSVVMQVKVSLAAWVLFQAGP